MPFPAPILLAVAASVALTTTGDRGGLPMGTRVPAIAKSGEVAANARWYRRLVGQMNDPLVATLTACISDADRHDGPARGWSLAGCAREEMQHATVHPQMNGALGRAMSLAMPEESACRTAIMTVASGEAALGELAADLMEDVRAGDVPWPVVRSRARASAALARRTAASARSASYRDACGL